MSPPSSVSGDNADAIAAPEAPSPTDQRSSTPPVPLLRPAQGAWDKAYPSAKQTQSQPQPSRPAAAPTHKSSPAAHTRSKDKRQDTLPDHSSPGHPVTHPESAQRHSQASSHTTVQPTSYLSIPIPGTTPSASDHRDHYRHTATTYSHPSSTTNSSTVPPPPRPRSNTSHNTPPPPPPPQYSHSHPPPLAEPPRRPYPASSSYFSPPYHPSSSSTSSATHYPSPVDPSYTRQELPTVVLLMEDMRWGAAEPDFQLAEVSVSLRPHQQQSSAEDAQGWWADGEEVMKALQMTPSRLEGSAKVFARRGKYRQCFVRFSEDGTMECQPSSLMVSREKTIELIIEPNRESYTPYARPAYSHPPPSSQPPVPPSQPVRTAYDHEYPQYGPTQAYPSPQYYAPTSTSSMITPGTPISNLGVNPNGKRNSADMSAEEHTLPLPKRARTSAVHPATSAAKRLGSHRPSSAVGLGLTQAVAAAAAASSSSTRLSSPEDTGASSTTAAPVPPPSEPISPYGPFQRHESQPLSGLKAPKEVINASIVAYLRSHIQKEDGYMDFAASKGRLLPIPDLLRGYRFATRIVNMWANRKTPPTVEGCPNKRITKNHVLQALFRQTSWGSDCEQTLQLADKYGPGGTREDPRVVEILSGGSMLPEKSGDKAGGGGGGGGSSRSQGSVALLDFLKDIDREHKARTEEESRKSASSSGGGKDAESGREGEAET